MTIAAELPRLAAIGLSGALLLASAIGGAIAVEPTTAQDKTEWLRTDTGRLKARIFSSSTASASPLLVVVLHGDAPFNKPDYQYAFARRAAAHGDLVAAAILRPGYTDPAGDTSDGMRGQATGDNYTADRVAMIVAAIQALQSEYHPRASVMVGHSGGAAMAADILAVAPTLADGALLLSCPCDVPRWRANMKEVHPAPVWDQPVSSLSPLELAPGVSTAAHIRMMVGAEDEIAPPPFTERYANRLAARGIDVQVTVIPSKGHEFFWSPPSRAAWRNSWRPSRCRRIRGRGTNALGGRSRQGTTLDTLCSRS